LIPFDILSGEAALWIAFSLFILGMLALDLGVFHRKSHVVGMREALTWSAVWIVLALVFNAGVSFVGGTEAGLAFLTGYLVERALSVDNIFIFLLIFSYFQVPARYQHRVLFWGILGALVMRAALIAVGVTLIEQFHWVIYVFGAFLVFTGVKILLDRGTEVHPEKNPVLRVFAKIVPTLPDFHGSRFTVKLDGKRYATALLPVLLVIEATDVVFALDSIPAIFGVTRDAFIVYTSNIFAILGLRSLYFLLASAMGKFHYLKYGLGLVLAFIGAKMLLSDLVHVSIEASLIAVVVLLAGSIAASLVRSYGAGGGRDRGKA
jgi:tellurite resistance protein TerC